MKKIIKINESELHTLIKESIYKILKETQDFNNQEIQQKLQLGEEPKNIFSYVGDLCNGFRYVEFNNKCNYINENNELFSQEWFDWCLSEFLENDTIVRINGKYYVKDRNNKTIDVNEKIKLSGCLSDKEESFYMDINTTITPMELLNDLDAHNLPEEFIEDCYVILDDNIKVSGDCEYEQESGDGYYTPRIRAHVNVYPAFVYNSKLEKILPNILLNKIIKALDSIQSKIEDYIPDSYYDADYYD